MSIWVAMLKKSARLPQSMLGTATVSGRLARTDRVYIGIDGLAGLVAGRALRSAPQALPALREQPEHARRTRRKQTDVLL